MMQNLIQLFSCSEGYKVLFRVALTIIKLNDRKIKAVEDPTEVFQILQNMPRRLIDCHKFMEVRTTIQYRCGEIRYLLLSFLL